MKTFLFLRSRLFARLQLPAALLIALLQRTPVLRVLVAAEDAVVGSPFGAVVRSTLAAAATLGSLHSLAGATVLAASRQSPTVNVGQAIDTIGFTVTDTINIGSWKITGNIPPGLQLVATQNTTIMLTGAGTLDATSPGSGGGDPYDPYGGGGTAGNSTTTPVLMGTPTTPGVYTFSLQAFEFGGLQGLASNTFPYTITVAGAASAPTVTTQPASQAAGQSGSVSLSVAASGNPTIQWQRNGADISGATSASLSVTNLQPANTGIYFAQLTNGGGTTTSGAAIVGLTLPTTTKVIGTGSEIAANIPHPNGNIFDQVSITGPAISVTCDPGQVLRTSCIDGNGDIIQVEFSGPGTLSVALDAPSGPAAPAKYNQAVEYMTGNVGIVITGATENTHLSVFSVGRGTAVNQALFNDSVTYDGFADIAFVAISSANGQFGGLRMANTSFSASKGYTGVYAPGVQFAGPVFIGDISAFGTATPVILLGGVAGTGGANSVASEVRITGGDLLQNNGRAVQVSGFTRLLMSAGTSSHYTGASTPSQFFNAQASKARLEQNGQDVTSQITINP